MRRIDHKRTHAYQGTVCCNGKEKTKCFSDLKYGGKKEALAAARKWQYANGKIDRVRKSMLRRPIKLSNTGVRGLTLRKKLQRSGNYSDVLQVHYSRNGRRFYAERSITLHTYEGAMREFLALRKENHRPKRRAGS